MQASGLFPFAMFVALCTWTAPSISAPAGDLAAGNQAAQIDAGANPDAIASMRVEDLGDVNQLEIEGVRTFSAADIRSALAASPDLQLAAHETAPLPPYLEQLRSDLTEGYRRSGFPDTQVSVRLNADSTKILVRVVEGPRYRAGLIAVVGAKSIPVDTLVYRLTHASPPPEKKWRNKTSKEMAAHPATWQAAQPAPELELRLWESGRFFGHTVSVAPIDEDRGKLKLTVDVMENELAPALSAALSPVERALLKFCDWAADFKEREEDLVLRLSNFAWAPLAEAAVELRISPRDGLLVSIRNAAAAAPESGGEYLLMGIRQIGWFSPGSQSRLLFSNSALKCR